MVNLNFIFLVGYLTVTAYYIYWSAQPMESCNDPNQCARSLFPPTDMKGRDQRYELELWTQHEVEVYSDGNPTENRNSRRSSSPKLEWRLLSTCSSPQMSFDVKTGTSSGDSLHKKHKFGGKGNNCTLTFPTFSRVRYDGVGMGKSGSNSGERPTLLKAMFVLKQTRTELPLQDNIIAKTVFDLTRFVELQKNSQVPHFKYNSQPIVLRIVADQNLYPTNVPIRGDGLKLNLLSFNSKNNGREFYHRPEFYVDDVALKHSSQIQLAPPKDQSENPRPPINLSIQVSIISPLRHAAHRQLELGFSMMGSILEPNELDEIRHMVSDEYIYRFILTQLITIIHVYLDYMAFRDEIGFYRGKTSMGGISMSSVVGRFVCQLIIFLYLCDGGNTSWLILGSVGSGVAIEFWKTTKFFRPRITSSFPFFSFATATSMSTLEKDTMNYDSIAHRFLGLILYPLVFGSALYSKKFHVYSSLWSWIISNLANAVYTFGFITLCPQLYVNYKLKSVAHLPLKVFIYKIFNTFVDDVFAFMIQMPLKHKLMTLRDDVVFVIFLVQAYIYRVDKTRTNEFGYAYEDGNADEKADADENADSDEKADTDASETKTVLKDEEQEKLKTI